MKRQGPVFARLNPILFRTIQFGFNKITKRNLLLIFVVLANFLWKYGQEYTEIINEIFEFNSKIQRKRKSNRRDRSVLVTNIIEENLRFIKSSQLDCKFRLT